MCSHAEVEPLHLQAHGQYTLQAKYVLLINVHEPCDGVHSIDIAKGGF